MIWYYQQENQQRGPVSDSDLDELLRSGTIRPETMVWREGMPNWTSYAQAKGGAANPAGTIVCSECGRPFPPGDVIQYGDRHICAACKPAFMQKVREGVPTMVGALDYAGFWIRFAAYFVDSIINGILGALIGFVLGMAMQPTTPEATFQVQIISTAFGFVVGLAYFVFFNGKYGATPGKMVCGIKIVTAEGEPIGYPRALGRYFAAILSGLICAIGYIMAAFDDEKRALHDRICSTRVVKK